MDLTLRNQAAFSIGSHEAPIAEALLLLAGFLTIGLLIPVHFFLKGLPLGLPESRSN